MHLTWHDELKLRRQLVGQVFQLSPRVLSSCGSQNCLSANLVNDSGGSVSSIFVIYSPILQELCYLGSDVLRSYSSKLELTWDDQ